MRTARAAAGAIAALVALAAGGRAHGTDAGAVAPPVAWQALAPGAERATLPGSDGATQILLFRFDLARYRAEVVVGAGAPPQPETAAALRHRLGAVAAVNGGF